MVDRKIRLDQRTPASGEPAAARYTLPHPRVTLVERCLLFIPIVMLPLQDSFPSVAGMSSSFLLFAALAAYVIVYRLRTLEAIWHHPVFIAAYACFIVSALLELSSPLPEFHQPKRFAEMIGGMVCVAVICRDRSALTAGLYGYIATALWVTVSLYLTGYEALQGMDAGDFTQAEKLRDQAFGAKSLGANLNQLAFVCAQGALVAFALCLSDKWKHLRVRWLGITAFCFFGTFLTMSRGAALTILVGGAIIFYTRGVRYGKELMIAAVLGVTVYMLVPDAVWSRMAFSTAVGESGKMEARARLYTLALDRLPQYIAFGVGAGNYSKKWAFENGFAKTKTSPGGGSLSMQLYAAHNILIQVTIYWGILGLSTFLLIVWCVYRSIPLQCGRDDLSLALLGIIVSLGLHLFHGTDFSDKGHAFGIGMLVGARRWIWPAGIVSVGQVSRHPSSADIGSGTEWRSG